MEQLETVTLHKLGFADPYAALVSDSERPAAS